VLIGKRFKLLQRTFKKGAKWRALRRKMVHLTSKDPYEKGEKEGS